MTPDEALAAVQRIEKLLAEYRAAGNPEVSILRLRAALYGKSPS
jgi:hypothetical protein